VNSGPSLFSRANESYSKILNGKSIFNTVKNFWANSDFQGKRRVAQKSWMVRNIFNTVKIFRGTVFQASTNCSKILNSENIFNTVDSVYIHFGVIPVIWVSVVCNLDQNREWLKWLWFGPSSRFLCQVFPAFFRTILSSVAALILTSNFSWLAEVAKFWS